MFVLHFTLFCPVCLRLWLQTSEVSWILFSSEQIGELESSKLPIES